MERESIRLIDIEIRMLENALNEAMVSYKRRHSENLRRLIYLLRRDIVKRTEERKRIVDLINSLPDDRQRQIAYYHLIGGQTFDEIAEEMHYTKRYVFRIWKDVKTLFE